MRRIPVLLAVLALAGAGAPSRGQTPAEFVQTAAFAAAHQNPDGGFAAKPGQLSSLGATNSGLRVLKHVGGSVPDVFGCIKYVRSSALAGQALTTQLQRIRWSGAGTRSSSPRKRWRRPGRSIGG